MSRNTVLQILIISAYLLFIGMGPMSWVSGLTGIGYTPLALGGGAIAFLAAVYLA